MLLKRRAHLKEALFEPGMVISSPAIRNSLPFGYEAAHSGVKSFSKHHEKSLTRIASSTHLRQRVNVRLALSINPQHGTGPFQSGDFAAF